MKKLILTFKRITFLILFLFSLITLSRCTEDPVDIDIDNDGVTGTLDNCISISNRDQADNDGDSIGDACDDDDDNDGILDIDDNFPFIPNNIAKPLNECINGMAGNYPCKDYDLMAHISIDDLAGNGEEGNDCWGWTDPVTFKEYALMGVNSGTIFVDITDTENLVILGRLPTATVDSSWRDIKVYQNFAYIVSEASNHGMQVFDLTKLRNITSIPQTFAEDAYYTEFGTAHNLLINEDTGFAYAVGTSTFAGGAHFINIQDPLNPISAGGYSADGYSHDIQVVTYNGPDSDYIGREILVGSNGNEVVIADVTNKDAPVGIKTIDYPNIGYTHQGWFSEDLKYFIVGDEFDEVNNGGNTRTLIFDLTDLDNPILHTIYNGQTTAIDHNGYVNGNTYYLANYTAGVRFIDISDIANKNITEVGYFDSYPNNNNLAFNGAWNIFPYFASGNILISDTDGGLFVVRKSKS